MLVYLDGEYVEHSAAKVSVDDRGFLFADGVYEVVFSYSGRPFEMAAHMGRMRYGLEQLRIRADISELPLIADRLISENDLQQTDATIYMQVTRGAAPRKHAFPPAETPATVYVIAKPFKHYPETHFTEGVRAITVPDIRWSRCDIKSIALLPNILANEQAHEAGAFEAIFVRDGMLTEGSHSNVWAVIDGVATTYEAGNYVLAGVTRKVLFERAQEIGVRVREAPIRMDELDRVEEIFLSGTTTEVMPVVMLDDRRIGTGKPGPVALKLQAAYSEWRA